MKRKFDYFVVLAEMRTGSNFLESNINSLPDLACIGEAFNPHFIGYPNRSELLGVTLQQREHDPERLLEEIKSQEKLTGFRFFHDHDPRIVEEILQDQRCAKIILARNPIESYVSWKIAVATGQWKLTNVTRRKAEKITFEPEDFARYLQSREDFRARVSKTLKRTGQTPFYLDYEDLHDIDVLNGLTLFLGSTHKLESLNKNLKKQNPKQISEKLTNPEELSATLASLDRFGLERLPDLEPARQARVSGYVACENAPLLYLPIPSGPNDRVKAWLKAVSGGEVQSGFNQKELRRWKRKHDGHRSFTVVRHPAARAHTAFCTHILNSGRRSYGQIRKTLQRVHKLELPDDPQDAAYDRVAHRAAFAVFLEFLKANLSGQTSIRVDGAWASQSAIIQGMANFAMPDLVLREETLETDLEYLAFRTGAENAPLMEQREDSPYSLNDIYDDDIERAVRAAYQRDYMAFGFGPWKAGN
ncbi:MULTISPECIES: sulfotransferase domain-containing protein [Halocynthiibacter]|uniref:Sulfotransferase domain-containing protein n=1 Tax=Halocynthiibacter halioticoli TaxID=2986804 RepID=A0AAE3J059_9RHOB|nr:MULTISPECIES: sulfotransferase domain-containing protein [Halocynthiibacter]MCV6825547.1 sulfotransferase domain-containing protein [Halocynthiibacter halioticoli]MCW4058548.1 sulfotransferase domain-containing protein [Halocynthiibacter sp. SDUM655004]